MNRTEEPEQTSAFFCWYSRGHAITWLVGPGIVTFFVVVDGLELRKRHPEMTFLCL